MSHLLSTQPSGEKRRAGVCVQPYGQWFSQSCPHKTEVLVAQSCPTLCEPKDCSPPSSSVHGILQARILEWVAMPSSRGSSQSRDQITSPALERGFFTTGALRKPKHLTKALQIIQEGDPARGAVSGPGLLTLRPSSIAPPTSLTARISLMLCE